MRRYVDVLRMWCLSFLPRWFVMLVRSRMDVGRMPSEVYPFCGRPVELEEARINLIVPSVNPEHRFGGVNTALLFFGRLEKHFKLARIITTDIMRNKLRGSDYLANFSLTRPESDAVEARQVVAFGGRRGRTIPVSARDVFVATAWWTSYMAQRLLEWQSDTFGQPILPLVYLIQDYECGFYNWSTRFALADSTYRWDGPTIAVVNSTLLKDYLTERRYHFHETFCFEPRLPKAIRTYLGLVDESRKKRRILFYGRPTVGRNCFSIVVEALRLWANAKPYAAKWDVCSIGETHGEIKLRPGMKVTCLGKLPIQDYAATLAETAVGISLMISPHTSYPPLEMAHFGCLVISNSFENKNISLLHDNFRSVSSLTPGGLAEKIDRVCREWENDHAAGIRGRSRMPDYLSESEQFPFADQIAQTLRLACLERR